MTDTLRPPANSDSSGQGGSTPGHSRNPRLEVTALSDHEWRVCDRILDRSDPRRVIGYIEHKAKGYEVLALLPGPKRCGRFGDWDSALGAIAAEFLPPAH
jgi:hypothetical protein